MSIVDGMNEHMQLVVSALAVLSDMQHYEARGTGVPPAPRDKFATMLQESLERSGATPDRNLLTVDDRRIDLYRLHTEVLRFGGAASVSRSDSF